MTSFTHPEGLYSFTYPSSWVRCGPVSDGASFAAAWSTGELLFEVLSMRAPDERRADAVAVVSNVWLRTLEQLHSGFTVIAERDRFACRHACERTIAEYVEMIPGRSQPVRSRTSAYVLGAGCSVVMFNFKVVAALWDAAIADMEAVVRSAEISD